MLKQDVIGEITQELPRNDGSSIRIVVKDITSPWDNQRMIDTYVLHRASNKSSWKVLSNRPHPDARTMCVDDYAKYGRSALLQELTRREQLIVLPMLKNALGKPLNYINTLQADVKASTQV